MLSRNNSESFKKCMRVTCFSSSSTTSSNKFFAVAPDVFDDTATNAGKSLICNQKNLTVI